MSYYRIDSRNLSFAELWRSGRAAFPISALLKVLRISLPMRIGIGHPTRVLRVDDSELDLDGRSTRFRKDFEAFEQAAIRF